MKMLLGSRVVRGPDWRCDDQDGGEGSVGTIISVTEFDEGTKLYTGTVLVCWDNGFRAGYRVGLDGCYDLRLLDSAPSGVVFNCISCNGCVDSTIFGTCWHCDDCPDYNLCTKCYMNGEHFIDHTFICKVHEHHQGICVGKRSASDKVQAKGIFPAAKVVPISEAVQLGTGMVIEVSKPSQSGILTVYWDEIDDVINHNMGYKGEVELKLIKGANGPMYYRDHLPIVALDDKKLSRAMAVEFNKHHKEDVEEEELDLTKYDESFQELYMEEELDESSETDEVLEVGDRVTIHLNKDVESLCEGMEHIEAAKFVGEIGKITKIDKDGVFVKYEILGDWKFLDWTLLSKVPDLRVEDVVRLTDNIVALIKLQEGHKGFNDNMEKDLNALGRVVEVDKTVGTAKVEFHDGHLWWFNPAALKLISNREEELDESSETDEVLEVGDRVTIHLNKDVESLCEGMEDIEAAKFVGEIGKITKISQYEGVFVEYEILGKWHFLDDWTLLSKVPDLRVEDVVRLTDNIVALNKLQEGHKGFNDNMEKDLNALGRVVEVDKTVGTAKVEFHDGHSWWFNPAALKLISNREERVPPVDSVNTEDGGQIVKVPNKGPPDFLVAFQEGVGEVIDGMMGFLAEGALGLTNKGVSMMQKVEQNISKAAATETLRQLKEEYPDTFDECKKANVTEPETETTSMPNTSPLSLCWPMHDPDSDEVYKMKSSPRGLLVIINNERFTVKELTNRVGSQKDENELVDLFTRYLDFKPQILRDKSRLELLQELRKISENEEYGKYDCLALCIMSHGKDDFFYDTDGREVKVSQVRTFFTNSRCEIFRGKPKLFFIQACRGTKGGGFSSDGNNDHNNMDLAQTQAETSDPDMADILVVYPCFEGYSAFRDSEGSIFIQSLVKVFRQYSDKDHIGSMLIRVNKEVYDRMHGKSGRTQVSNPSFTMTKFLYFWPGMKFDCH